MGSHHAVRRLSMRRGLRAGGALRESERDLEGDRQTVTDSKANRQMGAMGALDNLGRQ